MWQPTELLARAAALAAMCLPAAIMAACSDLKPTKSLTIAGVTYTFPKEHLRGFLLPDQGGPLARVDPPGADFLLEHSDSIFRPNQQGSGVPSISHVNDVPLNKDFTIEVIRRDGDVIVCRPGPLAYNCGFRVIDAGVPWDVRFTQRDLEHVDRFRKGALAALAGYRS